MDKNGIYCNDLEIGEKYSKITESGIVNVGKLIKRISKNISGSWRNGYLYDEKLIFERDQYDFKTLSGNSDLLPFFKQ